MNISDRELAERVIEEYERTLAYHHDGCSQCVRFGIIDAAPTAPMTVVDRADLHITYAYRCAQGHYWTCSFSRNPN